MLRTLKIWLATGVLLLATSAWAAPVTYVLETPGVV